MAEKKVTLNQIAVMIEGIRSDVQLVAEGHQVIRSEMRQMEERKDKPIPRVSFQKGEGVRVIEGPFTNFIGVIEEINATRGKLKVLASIFGRQTPIELEFWQVERL